MVQVDQARPQQEILNVAGLKDRLPEVFPPRTVDDIERLHRELFFGVDAEAGRLRVQATFDRGEGGDEVGFVPALPERIRPELESLLSWMKETEEPPVLRAGLVSHEIESIQPFQRGNGRLARLLAHIVLFHTGCPNARYILLDHGLLRTRKGYHAAMLDTERARDHTPWLTYFANVARDAYEDGARRFRLHMRADGDLNERQWRVAEWFARRDRDLPGRRHRFSEVHAAFSDIPERTLQRDLATLRDRGILDMEGKWKGARYVYLDEGSGKTADGTGLQEETPGRFPVDGIGRDRGIDRPHEEHGEGGSRNHV